MRGEVSCMGERRGGSHRIWAHRQCMHTRWGVCVCAAGTKGAKCRHDLPLSLPKGWRLEKGAGCHGAYLIQTTQQMLCNHWICVHGQPTPG